MPLRRTHVSRCDNYRRGFGRTLRRTCAFEWRLQRDHFTNLWTNSSHPESLIESELFGYVKGAFTGAVSDRKGLFEEASGGTIFLDEIGEASPAVQVRLLRVLQERKIRPVGARHEKIVDVRVIAATNCDLKQAVAEGRFRSDLYYRLNWFPIRMPALRERPSDIPLLIEHFLGPTKLEKGGIELLRRYQWPGNVRELMW